MGDLLPCANLGESAVAGRVQIDHKRLLMRAKNLSFHKGYLHKHARCPYAGDFGGSSPGRNLPIIRQEIIYRLPACKNHWRTIMLSLDDYISKAHHLVPAPQILPQLLPLLNQPDIDSAKVVELISYNQSLTANVLRICNSAYYSRGTSIDNLQDAVTRIGFRQLYDIVVCIISSVTLARPQKGYGVEAHALWDHSVTSALAAQVIAQEAQVDQQVVFTGALLHDIGKIVLSSALEEMPDQVARESE